jgi:tRNA (pseudouridine54-N1)-methyltransferase
VDGRVVSFVRPDERSLASMVQKALGTASGGAGFVPVRTGIAIADGGLDAVLADLGPSTLYILEQHATDVRAVPLEPDDPVFFIGDHLGFDEPTRAHLAAIGAGAVGVGPVSVHADDAITLVSNELDRRGPSSAADA